MNGISAQPATEQPKLIAERELKILSFLSSPH